MLSILAPPKEENMSNFCIFKLGIMTERKSLEERNPRRQWGWECAVCGHGMRWGRVFWLCVNMTGESMYSLTPMMEGKQLYKVIT